MARRRIVTGMPHIDIGRQLREVQRRHGVGPAQMIKEMGRLAAGPGYIGPSEYFIYRLFEQQRDFSEKLAFCGKRRERAMHGACNDPHWVALANDKLVTYSFLSAYGFPVPEVLAFYHPKGRPAPKGVVALGDGVDLDRFLRSIDRPLFGKPLDGYHSLGCVSMVGHDPDGDVVRLTFGQHVAVGTLRDYRLRWQAVGKDGKQVANGERELKDFGSAVSLTGNAPATAVKVIVTLVRPSGTIAAEDVLERQ